MELHLAHLEVAERSKLNSLDPRLKLVFSLLGLLIMVSTSKALLPLAVTFLAGLVLVLGGTPWSYLGKRMLPAFYIGSVVLITQIFLFGSTPLFQYNWSFGQVVGYREGLEHGFLLMSRILGAMSLMVFLTATSTINQLIFAAAWLKVPHSMIEIMTIAYRYIFVLLEEAERIHQAQKVRLGHQNWKSSLKSFGNLGGMVILRVFDKSNKLFSAMRCRGYQKSIRVTYQHDFTRKDLWSAVVLTACLLGALIAGF